MKDDEGKEADVTESVQQAEVSNKSRSLAQANLVSLGKRRTKGYRS